MFHNARIKLTAWYLAIILLVSLAFSVVIYTMLSRELDRVSRVQRIRFERRITAQGQEQIRPEPAPPVLDPELIEETKHRVIFILFGINGAILLIAGGLGYVLAGKTLRPIQDMVDEQNRFISDSSHELRTPLTALKSSLEVALRDPNLSLPDAKSLLRDSVVDVDRLQALSDGLLTLAQFQKPVGIGQFRPVSVQQLVTDSVHDVSGLAKQKHIVIHNKGKDGIVEGSPDSLHDTLVILLDNAIKYSPQKSVISVSFGVSDAEMLIRVTDTGIGISADDMPHIFDRFFRSDEARSTGKTHGYGLGLSIAKKIIDAHNGNISVVSKPGKGSTFTVRLPEKQHKPFSVGSFR